MVSPLKFRRVGIEDCDILRRYARCSGTQMSDFSVANLFGWRHFFNTEYAVFHGYLVVRFTYEGQTSYMVPIADEGNGSCCERVPLTEIVELLRENAFLSGHDFVLYGVGKEMAESFAATHEGAEIAEARNQAGYLYRRESLATLAGRKLQQKRNHVNKFKTLYPGYEYRELTEDLVGECLTFARRWREAHVTLFPEQRESAEHEGVAIGRGLRNMKSLGIVGGTLWVDGRMVAFTYGCEVSERTIDVCVEKADTDYQGAYAMINQLFAQHLPEQYEFMNREEDLGVAGLRQAKLSYQPEKILTRYRIFEPLPYPVDLLSEAHELYQHTFADTDWFATIYFSRLVSADKVVASFHDGRMVGGLHLLPYDVKQGVKWLKGGYVSAVAVEDDFRGRGIGDCLLREAHVRANMAGMTYTLLIPASQTVAKWYERMGYAAVGRVVPEAEGVEKMTYEEYREWMATNEVALVAERGCFEVAQKDLVESGICNVEERGMMVRIVNTLEALNAWAAMNKEAWLAVHVTGDDNVASNNGHFVVAEGVAQRKHSEDEREVSIVELAQLIFEKEKMVATMMMDV